MIGKKLINTGGAEAAFLPSQHFDTVTYTGNGGTQRIGGYINAGADFNGSSSYISSSNPFSGQSGAGQIYSVSIWFKADSFSNQYPTLFKGRGTGETPPYVWTNGSIIRFHGYRYGDATVSLNTDQWYHLAVIENNGVISGYLDGTSITFANQQIWNQTNGANLLIGGDPSSAIYYWDGKIDQVRIFDKALSFSEVTTLYGETAASTSKSVTDIFNDDSGIALYQLDGNANDTGGVSGKFGSAAIFNGSSSGINLPSSLNTSVIDATGAFSISMWINANDINTIQYLFCANTSNNLDLGINSNDQGIGKIVWTIYNTSYSYLISTTTITTNTWYNIVVTYNNGLSELFINGASQGTITKTLVENSIEPTLGYRNTGGSVRFNGKIDQVRIYSSALSSSDVTNLYNETSVPTANLVAHYKLDGDARDEQQQYDGAATNVIYAYDGTPTNVTYQKATDFQPDLVWGKARTDSISHILFDSVRGENRQISTNNTTAELLRASDAYLFNSNGFTVTNAGNLNNTVDYVAWCFKGGGTAVSNTNGTITSQVSANQAAGFSIVSYNTGSTHPHTVGTGLNQKPDMVITKVRNVDSNWAVWHKDFADLDQTYMLFNTTAAATDSGVSLWNYSNWGDNKIGGTYDLHVNNNDVIAYCFHSVEGYSKIGSYTGATGRVIVETGFQPKWIMIKDTTDGVNHWVINDADRDTSNPRTAILFPNLGNAEGDNIVFGVNFTSNGFEIPSTTTSTAYNKNGNTYIYLAIAADPDVTQPVVENSFDVVTYTGTSSTQTINTDFKPDLVWIKSRSNPSWHSLQDSVRGATKTLFSNTTNAEITYTDAQTSFDSNGFTLGADVGGGSVNVNGRTYVAWCWKAGDHDDNLPQINTNGTIDSIVSVNAAAGFSIVKWGGSISSSSESVGHGLSIVPELVILKNIDQLDQWYTFVNGITSTTQALKLNSSDAIISLSNGAWGNGATSTVMGVRPATFMGSTSQSAIMYCFHSVSGYQKVGSYTGNGSSGGQTITGLGFNPRFLLVKNATSSAGWRITDSVRGDNIYLYPNLANADDSSSGYISLITDGFRLNGLDSNTSDTFIYLAIA